MIASYSSNFIFLKGKKTAGSSMEIVISPWCSGRDVCSLLAVPDELTRRSYGGSPRNFCHDPAWEEKYLAAIASGSLNEMYELWEKQTEHRRVHAHMPAAEVRSLLPDLWPGAYKFIVERHPYEKAVSLAWWHVGNRAQHFAAYSGPHIWKRLLFNAKRHFRERLDWVIESGVYMNAPIYMIAGALAVDEVIPYDRAWSRLSQLALEWGKSIPEVLPRANGHQRRDRRQAVEVLSDFQKRKIYNDARIEFDLVGFRP